MTVRLLRRAVDGSLYEAKTILAQYPSIAVPLARRRGQGHGTVFDEHTELVIDGYPRSANQFAIAAIRHAEARDVRIANRTHAPGHLIAAADAGLPVLVLIRRPEDAILGWVLYKGNISVAQALRAYVRFYRPMLSHRGRFVVADFAEITSDFGAVTRRVNERFGTRFAEFDHTKENQDLLFTHMELHEASRLPPDQVERIVGRPSQERDRLRAGLREEYRSHRLRRPRAAAERLYTAFTGRAAH
jgi:hypothetical protein